MPAPAVRACVDRELPTELLLPAMCRAVRENPANAPALNRRLLPPGVSPDVPRAFLAAVTGKLWRPGRTLHVHFLDGDPRIQARVAEFAALWSHHANIAFVFDNDPNAEIRISFRHQGSWSYIGTDALVIPPNQPTMNFGWLTLATPNDEIQRVVLHEFGHALGCIHEHQNPATEIPWDKETVYAYFQGPPNYWNREQVDVNLFTRYSADLSQFSEFDPDSIMLYPIPEEFTVGDFSIGWNRTLSATDKSYIATLYPAARPIAPELIADAPPLEAYIGAYGALDTYTFHIEHRGFYRLETSGNTDVVMALYGPDDESRALAVDDDSGEGRNARIVSELRQGRYTVRIRHFSDGQTGRYRIGLYRAAPPIRSGRPQP